MLNTYHWLIVFGIPEGTVVRFLLSQLASRVVFSQSHNTLHPKNVLLKTVYTITKVIWRIVYKICLQNINISKCHPVE